MTQPAARRCYTTIGMNETATNATLNKLRAAVLGANDGIVSTASVVMGVAGATNNTAAVFTAGLAALVAGALSMAVGEYVSVSSQSDAEKAYIEREKKLLRENPEEELEQLAVAYMHRGVSSKLAHQVARELTAKDPIRAHLETQFNLAEDDVVHPTHAAAASFFAFAAGGIVPFAAAVMVDGDMRIVATTVAVLIALIVTGYISAHVGGAGKQRAIWRVIIGGLAAMFATYGIGMMFGTAIG